MWKFFEVGLYLVCEPHLVQGSPGALEGCSQTAASEEPAGRAQGGFMLRQIPQELSLKCPPDSAS